MTEGTSIEADSELHAQAELLRGFLSPATGFALPVNVEGAGENIIQVKLAKDAPSSGDEGYELRVTPDRVLLTAHTSRGIVWGIQTMRQLFPTEILRGSRREGVEWTLPCLTIVDAPRFSWRGLMIDYSRTFWNKEITQKYIDVLSFYKMNTLHMHLTDDQGWRLEISKYPALTEKGSKFDPSFREPPEHEGYYTKEDIRELLQYAGERNVKLIPEIEMPGHSLAALAAYPDLSCTGGPFKVGTEWGVYDDVYCAGNDQKTENTHSG
jgi:hexosaminidase